MFSFGFDQDEQYFRLALSIAAKTVNMPGTDFVAMLIIILVGLKMVSIKKFSSLEHLIGAMKFQAKVYLHFQ